MKDQDFAEANSSQRGKSMTDAEARRQWERQTGLKGDMTERETDIMRGKLPKERGGLLMD